MGRGVIYICGHCGRNREIFVGAGMGGHYELFHCNTCGRIEKRWHELNLPGSDDDQQQKVEPETQEGPPECPKHGPMQEIEPKPGEPLLLRCTKCRRTSLMESLDAGVIWD